MKRATMALLGAFFGLAVGCGGDDVEASGFARVPGPRAASRDAVEVPIEPAVASDRPVVRDDPAPEAPAEPAPAVTDPAGPLRERVGQPTGAVAVTRPAPAPEPLGSDAPPGSVGFREARAYELLEAGSAAEAAGIFSELIHAALIPDGAGEDLQAIARWVQGLERAQARHRWRALGDWPAIEAVVEHGEGLIVLRKRVLAEHPELQLCTGLIARANQLGNGAALQPGDTLRIPVERANVLVDLSARWVFYRFGDEIAAAWPAGVGKQGQETPPGVYTVGIKQVRPPWHPRGRAMIPYGDPENPLGSHWVGWTDENGRPTDVGFHGTSDESGVGGAVSRGCLRMRNVDVEVLHDTLPQGAAVYVQP